MISDLDIYRTANVLIREHGDDARAHAVKRHDALSGVGDPDGCALWKRIIRAVDELLAKERPKSTALQ